LIALIINARSAAETLIRKDQIMRDKPNSSAVGAACLAATPGEASGISPLHDVKIEDRKTVSGFQLRSLSFAGSDIGR
jgi:hypothetical protein